MHRYSIEPLVARFPGEEGGPDEFRAAAAIGVDIRTLRKWRAEGVDFVRADEAAIRAGTHPVLVWGDEWTDAPADEVEDFEVVPLFAGGGR